MARIAIVLPAATYRADDFLQAARTLVADVVVVTDAGQAMPDSMDPPPIVVDLHEVDAAASAIVAAGREIPLDAVVAVDDPGTVVAATAAAQLGLTHNPPEAVAATRDKARMRTLLADAGVAQPPFRLVSTEEEAVVAATELGYPVVVKPTTLSASRGVIRADDDPALIAAAASVRRILDGDGRPHDEPLLVERFIAGPEYAVEGLLRDGRLTVLAVFDKPDPLDGPYFEETLLVAPARVDAAARDELVAAASAAVAGLGLQEGPVHVELRRSAHGAVVLEAAARTIGGLCGRALRFGLFGEPLELLVLRHALGMSLPATTTRAPSVGAMMLPIPRSGTLHGVSGLETARSVPGVTGVEITVPHGGTVKALPEGDRYVGFIFAAGPDPDAVEGSLRSAAAAIDLDIR